LYEGFGLPLIEALSCGCPVVASDIAVFREIASAGCVFVDPGDTEAIAVGIDQTSFMEVAPATSLAIADRFDWNNSYAMLKTVVEERLSLSKKPKIRFGH
jgi:glycosyltransferase involved in cell wall biosynthesis